jgi:hypothetical protein
MHEGIWIAALIAAAVAFVELLARYRDDPARAVFNVASFAYAAINACVAVLAAWWVVTFFPQIVGVGDAKALAAQQAAGRPIAIDDVKLAVAAGFGSLALMRTAVLKLHVPGGDEIAIGPALIIDQLLNVVDRSVDRHLAIHRADIADQLSVRVDFVKHATSLASLCLTLLQNPTLAEQQQITAAVQALNGRNDITPALKSTNLVLLLLGLVGEPVLRRAVDEVTKQ